MNDSTEAPLVKGGQGRTAESLVASAGWIFYLYAAAAAVIVGSVLV